MMPLKKPRPIQPRRRCFAVAGDCDCRAVGAQLLAACRYHPLLAHVHRSMQLGYPFVLRLTLLCDTSLPDKGRLETPIYKYWGTDPGNMPRFHWFPFPPVVFGYISHAGGPFEERTVSIAYWLLLLPTLPLPLIAIVRHRRRRQRETNNLCPTCGYDLRATPDRCPECGTSAPPARAVT